MFRSLDAHCPGLERKQGKTRPVILGKASRKHAFRGEKHGGWKSLEVGKAGVWKSTEVEKQGD